MIQSENENMNRNNENKKMNSFIVICEPLIRLAVSSYAIEFMGEKKKHFALSSPEFSRASV